MVCIIKKIYTVDRLILKEDMMDFKFELVKALGVLSEGSKGWKKELTIVSWNGRAPKFDIREWDEDHESMRKGVSFTKDELVQLKEILNQVDFDEITEVE